MIEQEQAYALQGNTLYSSDDAKVGTIGQVYLDDVTGRPEWLTVRTGFFGTNESFVPLQDATLEGDVVRVPYTNDHIKGAPNVAVDDGHLSPEEEQQLYTYYGVSYDAGSETSGQETVATETTTTTETTGTVGYDTSGPATDDAMTLSEEQLRVGTQQREAGRARLRKYVVTENVQTTVPVTREEVRVEREPITDANVGAAMDGPDISEEEHEVVLREETPVVSKETRPVERVRLGTEQVTEEQVVSDTVRREQVETSTDADTTTTGTTTGTTGTTGTT